MLTRRKVDYVEDVYGVDISAEEEGGRFVQHVEGQTPLHL